VFRFDAETTVKSLPTVYKDFVLIRAYFLNGLADGRGEDFRLVPIADFPQDASWLGADDASPTFAIFDSFWAENFGLAGG